MPSISTIILWVILAWFFRELVLGIAGRPASRMLLIPHRDPTRPRERVRVTEEQAALIATRIERLKNERH